MAATYYVEKGCIEVKRPRGRKRKPQSMSKCRWCGRVMTKAGDPWRYPTIDHIVPSSQKGTDKPENLKSSCAWCNSGRAAVNHCIVTLVCIEAIVGPSLSKIARYYNRSVKSS